MQGSAAACAYSIVHTEPRPLTSLRSGLNLDVDRVIAKALSKDPRERYQNAADLIVDLRHLSGQPVAVRGGNRGWKAIGSAAAAVTALFAAGYFYSHRGSKLTDKDTIILAEFANSTGDPVFDGTLRQGLAIELGQSPFLSLERLTEGVELLRSTGVRFVVVHPHDYAEPSLAADLVRRMRAETGVATEHIIGHHYVFELRPITK